MIMGFSWEKVKKYAVNKKLYRARIMSGGVSKEQMGHSDWVILHPDWVRDANQNPASMNKIIRESILKKQEFAIKRRLKQLGK